MRKNLLFIISLFTAGVAQGQDNTSELLINEIMQSNVETIMDDITEFPDSWVELYNAGDANINLKDYAIGIKTKASKAWQLPDKTIAPKGYVLIYCDKENENGKSVMHANFRLESGKGCVVYLFKGKEIVDSLPEALPKMPAPDVAYGRKTDGAKEWGYQLTPTPNKANTGEICDAKKILGNPVFSENGRVMTSQKTISLTLSLPEDAPEGAYITYTTNGSEPTAKSTKYTKAFSIKSNTVIRAKVFCEGYLSPMSTAQSYIFHPRSWTIPVVSIQTDDKYLNDKKIGLFANNNSKEDKKDHDWRRPLNIEFFPEEGQGSAINLLGEFRIQGGQSRSNALKSLALYANKRFDPVNKRFVYEFFPDQKPGIKDFKSISLRDGGNDFGDMYFRDAIIQRTMAKHVDLDWQACRSAVVYINGEYMGMLNIRERSNEENIYSNYDGLEDLDMIEISHEKVNNKDMFIEELKEGSDEFYNSFKEFYSQKGHSLAEYEEWMDVSEYLNVMVMNLFYGNIDFPGNNIVFWRPNDDDTKSGLPKRWRVIVKDTDFGLGLYNRKSDYNTIKLIYDQSYDSGNAWAFTEPATRLFRNMMEDEDVRQMFIDKSCIYMGDFLNAKGTGEIMDLILDEALEEFVAHRDKYNPWGNNRQDIQNKFNDAKKWLAGYTEQGWGGGGWGWGWPGGGGGGGNTTTYLPRTDYFCNFIGSQYKLGDAISLTVNKDLSEAAETKLTMNGIELTDVAEGVFDGKFFPNRALTISAKAPSGKVITGWKVKTTPTSGSAQTKEYSGSVLNLTTTACKSMAIEAIIGTESGIDAVYSNTRTWSWKRTNDGFIVTGVPEGTSVSLHDLHGITSQSETSTGSDIILPAERGKMYLLKVGGETIKIQ